MTPEYSTALPPLETSQRREHCSSVSAWKQESIRPSCIMTTMPQLSSLHRQVPDQQDTLRPHNPITQLRECGARAVKVLQTFLDHPACPKPGEDICPGRASAQIQSWRTQIPEAADVGGPCDVLHWRGHTRIPTNCWSYNFHVDA